MVQLVVCPMSAQKCFIDYVTVISVENVCVESGRYSTTHPKHCTQIMFATIKKTNIDQKYELQK